MEEQWQVDRARLRRLRQQQPDWTHTQLAQELGYSESWVKKWSNGWTRQSPIDLPLLFHQLSSFFSVGGGVYLICQLLMANILASDTMWVNSCGDEVTE